MDHLHLFNEVAIVIALAVGVTLLLSKFKLPTVAGLLAAGAVMGPNGFGFANSINTIMMLAEVGVVLLLFSIGLEFSVSRLRDIFRQVALGGATQVVLTALAATLVALALGQSLQVGVFYGFVFALSSTAIVLRSLNERRELDAPHGRFIVGTLIFQDLCVVPMVLIVPLLGASIEPHDALLSIGIALLRAAMVVFAMLGISRYIVPKFLGWVDASRSREVFLFAILGLCVGTAWLTSQVGLSLALGAFLGGMVVADTEYGHRAMGDILPLRDAFVSIFFVSLGMLFDVRVVLEHPWWIAILLAGFVLAKGLLATFAAQVMRFPPRVAWLSGVGLAQFGEFGFVLTQLAQKHQVLPESHVSPLLSAGILSMFFTPLLSRLAPHITAGEKLLAPLEKLLGVRSIDEADDTTQSIRDHIVIIGFGVAGQMAARTLRMCNVPLLVLELNADNVRLGKKMGLPVYYGDATSEEALRHAHIEQAKSVVLLINDSTAAERVVDTLRRVAPQVGILMRTRYMAERNALFALGAHDVVAEEVEGAIEVISRMLGQLGTPRNLIDERIRDLRATTQTSERKLTLKRQRLSDDELLKELKIESVWVRDNSPALGQSPASLRIRSETGALLVGIKRRGEFLQVVDPTEVFEAEDVLYFVGNSVTLSKALTLVEPVKH